MSTTVANRTERRPADLAEIGGRIEKLAADHGPAALAPLSSVARSLKLADGIRQVRELVTQIVPHVRHLAGTPLGFKTDMDSKGGYDEKALIEPLTEAALRGFSWVGNEFNVIKGRFYAAKDGYARVVREFPGLTDLVLIPGVPKGDNGGCVVPFKATWKLNGKPNSYERSIPVRMEQPGVDAAIGKATRKMLASIHFVLTGSNQSAVDAESDPTEPEALPAVPSKAEELRNRLAAPPQPTDGRLFSADDGQQPPH